jgi:hypothetical protein
LLLLFHAACRVEHYKAIFSVGRARLNPIGFGMLITAPYKAIADRRAEHRQRLTALF